MYSRLSPPETSRWFDNSNGTYAIDWEDPEAQDKIREMVDFLIKGCTSKKGFSSNRYNKRETSVALDVSAKVV